MMRETPSRLYNIYIKKTNEHAINHASTSLRVYYLSINLLQSSWGVIEPYNYATMFELYVASERDEIRIERIIQIKKKKIHRTMAGLAFYFSH